MLIECPECKQQISNTAYFCPKCGFTRKKIWLEKTDKIYQLLAILLGLLSAIFFFLSSSNSYRELKDLSDSLKFVCLFGSIISVSVGWLTSKFNLKSD